MKRIIGVLLIMVFVSTLGITQDNFNNQLPVGPEPNLPEYKQGEILVKFRDEVSISVLKSAGVIQTGLSAIDALNKKWGVTGMNKVFRNAQKQSATRMINMPDGNKQKLSQMFNIYRFTFPSDKDVHQVIKDFKDLPVVEYAEVNGTAGIVGGTPTSEPFADPGSGKRFNQTTGGFNSPLIVVPNDPFYPQQWPIPYIKADSLWHYTTGDTNQVIGILDTGVDWLHPDLVNKIWTNYDEIPGNGIDDDANGFVDDVRGWDFVNDDNNPRDDNSHGTHCAGIAAAESNNGIGIAGVSWGAKIMPIKVFQSNGIGYFSDIAEGFWYAAHNGSTIFSNSWSSGGESMTIRLAMEYAYSKGLIVAAAGNMNYKTDLPFPPWPPYQPNYPACYNWVLGVEATDQLGNNTWFSNFDPTGPIISDGRPYGSIFWNDYDYNYEMRAPGVSFISTVPNGQYRTYSGTSMACPLVAGSIALMKSFDTTLSNEQVFAKLIQPIKINAMQAGVLNILKCTFINPPPDLYFKGYTIADSLNGGDHDGRPDAGETFEMFVTVKNAGGFGDSIYAKLRFSEFEDTTVAKILDSTCYLGSISAYGTQTSFDGIKVKIDSNVADMRIISMQLLIYQKGTNDTVFQGITLTAEHGIEINGTYQKLHLQPNAYYIVTGPSVIDSLIVDPGVVLTFHSNMFIAVNSYLKSVGTEDSLITYRSVTEGYSWRGIIMKQETKSIFDWCKFNYGASGGGTWMLMYPDTVTNCLFEYCTSNLVLLENQNVFEKNVLTNLNGDMIIGAVLVHPWAEVNATVRYNIFAENNGLVDWNRAALGAYMRGPSDTLKAVHDNVFINNVPFSIWMGNDGLDFKYLPANYFGTTNLQTINAMIQDFYELPVCPVVVLNGILTSPPEQCHGVTWKVEINDQNLQGTPLVIGNGPAKFSVFFNRPMDTTFTPFLTFGVRFPYTQNCVEDSASWSADHKVWTAYKTIDISTGDGQNTIRVAYARDPEHFEIPIERSRFKFVVQAASSQAVDFTATPGIGKVMLEWPLSDSNNVLGYNMYRYTMLNDSTTSDTILINNTLITDSVYTDFIVNPGTPYYYMFTVVQTSFAESDYSKVIQAIPLTAANGDANGDMSVSVLDITAVIAYMLNQNPQPFLFDAADVNNDNTINVLDVIGIVDIILGKKKSISSTITSHPNPAYIFLDEDRIRFKIDGQVAALQFELAGQNTEQVRLIMKQQGFEFATGIVNGKLMGIIYNLGNRTLPSGMIDLIGIEGTSKPLAWGDVTAGDPQGQYVLVLKDAKDPVTLSTTELTAIPNPFKDRVTISYSLIEQASIQLEVFDSQGKLIRVLESAAKPVGSYSVEWDGKNVTSGLYYCRLTGNTLGGQDLKSEIKIMLTK